MSQTLRVCRQSRSSQSISDVAVENMIIGGLFVLAVVLWVAAFRITG